jgi:hypothetical protein
MVTEQDIMLHKLMKMMLDSIVDIKKTGETDVEVEFKHYPGMHDQSMHGNRYGSTTSADGSVNVELVNAGKLRNRANEHFTQSEEHARALESQRQGRNQGLAESRTTTGKDQTWKWQVGDRSYTDIQNVADFKRNFPGIALNTDNLNATELKTLNAVNASLKNLQAANPDFADNIKAIEFKDLSNETGKSDMFGKVNVGKDGTVRMTVSNKLTSSPTSATTALTHAESVGMEPKGCTTLAYPVEKTIGKGVFTQLRNSDNAHISFKDADGNEQFVYSKTDGTGVVKNDVENFVRINYKDIHGDEGLFGKDINNFDRATGKKDLQGTFSSLYAAGTLGTKEGKGNTDILNHKSVKAFGNVMTSVMGSKGGVSKKDAVTIEDLRAKAGAKGASAADKKTYRNAMAALKSYKIKTMLSTPKINAAQAEAHGRTA